MSVNQTCPEEIGGGRVGRDIFCGYTVLQRGKTKHKNNINKDGFLTHKIIETCEYLIVQYTQETYPVQLQLIRQQTGTYIKIEPAKNK